MPGNRLPLRPGLRSSRSAAVAISIGALVALIITSGPLPAGASGTPGLHHVFRTAKLAFTGDILPHRRVVTFARQHARNAPRPNQFPLTTPLPEMYGASEVTEYPEYDFVPMFEEVAEELRSADLAICHLETTISPLSPTGFPRFRAPPELVAAIAESGWDGCSVASNHAFDYGTDGVALTLEALARHGVSHTGTATSPESGGAAHYRVNGIHVGHLSYTYGLNGISLPLHEPWWVDLIATDAIVNDAIAAREEGAEFIVASMHWGTEYQRMPDAYQKRIARAIAETGLVDLLVGHHAHVLQPIDRIGEMWVAYGLGNFVSNQYWGTTRDGAILHIEIGDGPDGLVVRRVTYTPTWVDRTVMKVVPVADHLLDPGLGPWRRTTLQRSWAATVGTLGALGARALGVQPNASCCPESRVLTVEK